MLLFAFFFMFARGESMLYKHLLFLTACIEELLHKSQLPTAGGCCFICIQGLHPGLPALPWQHCMLLAPPCLPLTSPQLPCLILLDLFLFSALSLVSWFPDVSLFPANPRVSVCSSLQVRLHVLNGTRGGAGRALWDQTKLPSAGCIHTHWQTAMRWAELHRRLKGQVGDHTADAWKKAKTKKTTKPFSTDSCSHPVELLCYTKTLVQLKKFLPSSICLAGIPWSACTVSTRITEDVQHNSLATLRKIDPVLGQSLLAQTKSFSCLIWMWVAAWARVPTWCKLSKLWQYQVSSRWKDQESSQSPYLSLPCLTL